MHHKPLTRPLLLLLCVQPERPGPLPCKRSGGGVPVGSAPCEEGGWRQTKRVRTAAAQQPGKQHVPANKRQQQGAPAAAAAATSDAHTARQQAEPECAEAAGRVTAVVGRRGRATAVAAVLNGPLGGQAGAAQQQHACTCPLGAACTVLADYGGPSSAEVSACRPTTHLFRAIALKSLCPHCCYTAASVLLLCGEEAAVYVCAYIALNYLLFLVLLAETC